MLKLVKNIFDSNDKQIKKTEPIFNKIKELEPKMKDKPWEEIQKRVQEMKDELQPLVDAIPEDEKNSLRKIENRKKLPVSEQKIIDKLVEFMPEVYAMLNESYRRVLGYTYHDVQYKAGIILGSGQKLVEQYTGEGKTMTFQLPLALYSLVGRGSHLITVNDYLTKVGAEYAGHMLSNLGISVGVITPEGSFKFIKDEEIESYKGEEAKAQRAEQEISIDRMQGLNLLEVTKREAYGCDITYGTNNEFGFDYLRDNMAWEVSRLSQRELYFVIIDEADSILIDEARTPLIISATPSDADTEKYSRFAAAVKGLEEGVDFEVDHKFRSATLTDEGVEKVEKFLGVANAWDDYSIAYHLENALKAKALFERNDQYIVRNNKVLIVDEYTGRVLEGRRYSEGLHQAIEAKEGVEIQKESRTYATITFQNFFRMYKILCGGSGTIVTEGEEFYKIYGLESVVIPTNKPRIRKDFPDKIFKTAEAKWRAVAAEVKELHEIGRPVLVGTTSVDNSEIISNLLDKEGVPHEVLNAKFHEQESRIVSKAGLKGAVTVATNMAGRGTDIVIGGGKRGDAAWQEIADLGGLHVIGTERHDARRVDNQLRGRTGRQGEPGSTRFFVSLEDKIMKMMGGDLIAKLMGIVKVSDDTPIEMNMITKQIEAAQRKVESLNFESRKRVVDYDDVMNQHREVFYSRRKNIMIYGDKARGRIMHKGRLVNINLPKHEELKKKYEDQIVKAQKRVRRIAEDIVNDEIDFVLSELDIVGEIKNADKEKILQRLDSTFPVQILADLEKEAESKTRDKIEVMIESKNKLQLEEYLLSVYEKKFESLGEDLYNIVKMISLEEMDKQWVEHLEMMKGIREGVGLQGYAQRDPLVEYKNRAFEVFESFITRIDSEISKKIFRVTRVQRQNVERQIAQNIQTNNSQISDVLEGDREMTPDEVQTQKAERLLENIARNQQRTQASLRTNSTEKSSSASTAQKGQTYGRNDKVTVKYTDGREVKDVKFKKVQADVEAGEAVVVK